MKPQLRSYLNSLLRRNSVESSIENELRTHIELRAEDLERTGLTSAEALRRARIEFGPIETHKENIRSSLGLRLLDEFRADLRYAIRMLRRSPGFTAVAVASLALGIGANTIIFTLAKGILLDRLAVPQPNQLRLFAIIRDRHNSPLHYFWGDFYRTPDGRSITHSFSYPIYQLLRQQNLAKPVLRDLFAFKDLLGQRLTATIDGHADTVTGQLVSGNFYQQLGVQPALGRAIQPSDDAAPGSGLVAVISDGLWARVFGRSPSVIGKTIQLNLIPITIVGVNPPGFTGASSVQLSPDVFLPFSMQPTLIPQRTGSYLQDPNQWWMSIMGRTGPGVSDEAVRSAFAVWLDQDIRATVAVPKDASMPGLVVESGSQGLAEITHDYAAPIYVLSVLTGIVLLLACANLANLLLARSAARQREMSVRLALGASRSRVLRQVLTESLLLSSLGGIAGFALGYLGRNIIPHLLSSAWRPAPLNARFDLRIFAFAAAISILTGILFGLAPAWQATQTDVNTALKDAASSATRRRKGLAGKSIVVFQVALSMLLVVGAGLFARTLINLNTTGLGFDPHNLLLFSIPAPPARYPPPQDIALHQRIEERLEQVPGVQTVTLIENPLIAHNISNIAFLPTDQPKPTGDNLNRDVNGVGRSFFETYRIPILYGRSFGPTDTTNSPRVAVINQSLAHAVYPNIDPVGKTFVSRRHQGDPEAIYQIIGVSADAKYDALQEDPPPTFYTLYRQAKEEQFITYTIKTQLSPAAILPAIRNAIQSIDKDLPLRDIRTQTEQIDASISQQRLFATLTAGFGILALVLACIGIYGLMAYNVARRTSEIGVRMALGARARQVLWMVLRESSSLALYGIAIGLTAAFGLTRFIRTMLYGLQPTDPATFIRAALLLLAIAIAASYGPARRASRIDPMQALRHE
ncbi:MAG: efflux pump, inner rane subunit [Acidobacteriaceae bacterium]|nr:efflux pump, inner rane subunit [Acidobacteriaceae bacterium]